MLASVLALATAGGAFGTAYAGSTSGKQDRNPRAWDFPAPKPGHEKGVHWAVLNADGTVDRAGKDVVSSASVNPPGGYGVAFKKSVQGCAYVATIGSTGPSGAPSQGVAFVAPYGFGSIVPNAVYIDTKNQANSFADLPVYLVVIC
jgi:hypothetical protein